MSENNLSDNISTLRKQNNMSQEVLAEKLNVSRQAVLIGKQIKHSLIYLH